MIITIDFNNIILSNDLPLLKAKVMPIPVHTENIAMILKISEAELKALESIPKGKDRVLYINTPNFVQSIKGHAYVSYNKKRRVVKLMTSSGISYEQITLETMGVFPNDALIWVGIPLNSRPEIIKKSTKKLMTIGFGNPHLSPSGIFLSMVKKNDGRTKEITTLGQINYVLLRTHTCKMRIRLTEDASKYLRSLHEMGVTLNKDGSFTQKEIAGSLKLDKVDAKFTHYLSVDYSSLISGNEMNVPVVPGLYNFHSHPVSAYKKTGVRYGWPSPQDFIGFLMSYIQDDTILHIVTSIEGLYIISIGEYYKEKLPKDLDSFIKKKYNFCKKTHHLKPSQFVKQVNDIKYGRDHQLFKIQYLPWQQSTAPFRVTYKSKDSNCFSVDDTWKYYKRLYK